MGELLLRPAGGGWPGRCGGCRRRLGALHEGWVLLDEGGVHFGWLGPSCSTHNPWSVDPDPRGAGRLETRLKAEPASSHSLQGPLRRRRSGSGAGGSVTEAPGRAVRTPDSLLRGLVSTALTLPSLPANHPTEIVGILRFFLGEQSRLGVNVSAVDTDAPPDLFPSSCPRFQGHRPAQGSCPSGCLRSEETAHETHRP